MTGRYEPLVSVILPTRNRAQLLRRAVTSVLEQSLAQLELIVIDDGSDDETATVLAALQSSDDRIRTLSLPQRQGAATARNRGIDLGVAAWIAFIDDDCVWHPDKLAIQVRRTVRSEDAGVVYCPYTLVRADGSEIVVGSVDVTGAHTLRKLLRRNVIGTPTALVRRETLQSIGGFDERLPRFQDWDLWLRAAARVPFAFVPEPLTRCGSPEGGISTSTEALRAACNTLSEKFHRELPLRRGELADLRYALGHLLMLAGVTRDGSRMIGDSVLAQPWPPRRIIMALCALLGARPYQAVVRARESRGVAP